MKDTAALASNPRTVMSRYSYRKYMTITREATMIGIARGVIVPGMLASVVFLTGCAFGVRRPTLIYPPEIESGGTSVAHAA